MSTWFQGRVARNPHGCLEQSGLEHLLGVGFQSDYNELINTLFLIGPRIPGGSCSLADHVTPLSEDLFIKPLHLFQDVHEY